MNLGRRSQEAKQNNSLYNDAPTHHSRVFLTHGHETELVLLLPGNSNRHTVARSVEAQSFQETGHLLVTPHSLAKRNESKWVGGEFIFPETLCTIEEETGF